MLHISINTAVISIYLGTLGRLTISQVNANKMIIETYLIYSSFFLDTKEWLLPDLSKLCM